MKRFVFILLVLFATQAIAAVPQTINYQGYLTGSGGSAVNSAVDMTFTIYNAATSGMNLWTEDQTVQVNNGIYAVALGAINPIDPAIIDGDLWLGVKVGTDAEMTPRQRLNSVPFASRSDRTDDPLLHAFMKKHLGDFSYLVDNGDGTVTDPVTGKMWTKNAIDANGTTWYESSGTYNSTYNPATVDVCGTLSVGGYSDWVLPEYWDLTGLFPTDNKFDIHQASFPFIGFVEYISIWLVSNTATGGSYRPLYIESLITREQILNKDHSTTTDKYILCIR